MIEAKSVDVRVDVDCPLVRARGFAEIFQNRARRPARRTVIANEMMFAGTNTEAPSVDDENVSGASSNSALRLGHKFAINALVVFSHTVYIKEF